MDGLLSSLGEIIQAQSWLAFPAAFAGGIASSASPCVLPTIPLIIGYVGGYAEGSKTKAVQYSLVFVLGLTITFTLLGVLAGTLGRLFGDVGDLWKYLLPPVAVVLGLFLLGVLNMNVGIPQRFVPKQKALLGALLMGLFFGIIASPCATPVLGVILLLAAANDNIAYSGSLLLAYALGHWILVLGAGISVGFAQRALASTHIRNISSYTKKAAGVILIVVGLYFAITSWF
ncbi:MAG: cytochrome c biogenesis CcdA family protein [Dehalogenimonas sp.]